MTRLCLLLHIRWTSGFRYFHLSCIFPAMREGACQVVTRIKWHQVVCCCWMGRVYCHSALSAVLNLYSTVNDEVRGPQRKLVHSAFISIRSMWVVWLKCWDVSLHLLNYISSSPLAGSSLMALSPVHNCMSLRLKTPLSSLWWTRLLLGAPLARSILCNVFPYLKSATHFYFVTQSD